ncbi:MAG TPA: methionine adenosyltransferase [Candidatus Saccharimonadales bacterium]|nr:methionine adenosyltransferase [Candidatus Saccharimonadales bacterium]
MSQQPKLFTSESVCAGHPDKICDYISDAILDEALRQDPSSHTAIETVVGENQISLFGEVKTKAKIDYEALARSKIAELGYTKPEWKFSDQSNFSSFLHQQSSEISVGVDPGGAGDQGIMFGYALDESKELMPLPIMVAHALTKRIDECREKEVLDWLRPDGKAQVTIQYMDGKPIGAEKTVLALAHSESVDPKTVKNQAVEHIIRPVIESFDIKLNEAGIVVNGTGVWHIPGPESDAGLTGRKIVVDTYGGYARVGGGALSGKDPTKVDRSGAYAARYIAKNVVAAGMASECEVALAYVIGQPKPLMQTVETFGSAKVDSKKIETFANNLLDTSVQGIIKGLDLKKPIYSKTSVYGHFGKPDLPWEKIA